MSIASWIPWRQNEGMNTTPTILDSTTDATLDRTPDVGSQSDLSTCTRTRIDPTEATSAPWTPLVADPSTPVESEQIIALPAEPPDRTVQQRPTRHLSAFHRAAYALLDLVDMSATPSNRALASTDGGYRSARG